MSYHALKILIMCIQPSVKYHVVLPLLVAFQHRWLVATCTIPNQGAVPDLIQRAIIYLVAERKRPIAFIVAVYPSFEPNCFQGRFNKTMLRDRMQQERSHKHYKTHQQDPEILLELDEHIGKEYQNQSGRGCSRIDENER